jgi:hypothetical protein
VQTIDWNADGIARIEQALDAIATELARGFTLAPGRPPYPGIHAFEADDAAIYFGRDEETRAIIERLDARRTQGGARFLAIIGASGAGKSSLLKAGLLPQLSHRSAHWITLPPTRPNRAPLDEFAKGIAEQAGTPETWRDWRGRLTGPDPVGQMSEWLDDLRIGKARGATLLVPFDQFEEVFTLADTDERDRFLRLLADLLSPARKLPLIVVATGRADLLDGLLESGELGGLVETVPLLPCRWSASHGWSRAPRPSRRSASRRGCRSGSQQTSATPKPCRCSPTRCGFCTNAVRPTSD